MTGLRRVAADRIVVGSTPDRELSKMVRIGRRRQAQSSKEYLRRPRGCERSDRLTSLHWRFRQFFQATSAGFVHVRTQPVVRPAPARQRPPRTRGTVSAMTSVSDHSAGEDAALGQTIERGLSGDQRGEADPRQAHADDEHRKHHE